MKTTIKKVAAISIVIGIAADAAIAICKRAQKTTMQNTLFEIIGREDSELCGMVFGHFTTREYAEKGYQLLPEEIREETEIKTSNLAVNTVEVDGEVIDLANMTVD